MSIRAQLIIGAVLVAGSVGTTWVVQGWRYDAKIAAIERSAAIALSDAQAAARKKEQDYARLNARIDGQYIELATAQLEAADLRAAVSAGDKRLSVRTTGCTVPANSGATSMGDEAPRADIDPRDASDIIAILARGDTAIRQLNALQDWAVGISAPQ